jgi:hypothetical protein
MLSSTSSHFLCGTFPGLLTAALWVVKPEWETGGKKLKKVLAFVLVLTFPSSLNLNASLLPPTR